MIAISWKKYVARKTRIGIVIDFAFLLALICVVTPPIRRGIVTYALRCTLAQPQRYDKIIYLSAQDSVTVKTLQGADTVLTFPPRRNCLINAGNVWSAQTRAELRSLNEFALKHAQTTDVFFIATDDPEETARYFRRKNYSALRPLTTQPADEPDEIEGSSSALLQEMKLSEPASVLVDTTGSVWIKRTGAAKWTGQKIEALMSLMEGK